MKQKQFPLWLNPGSWRAGGVNVPAQRPGDPDGDAEHQWENEGGNPPLTEPPDASPRKHL
jgi:hypothetical protein